MTAVQRTRNLYRSPAPDQDASSSIPILRTSQATLFAKKTTKGFTCLLPWQIHTDRRDETWNANAMKIKLNWQPARCSLRNHINHFTQSIIPID